MYSKLPKIISYIFKNLKIFDTSFFIWVINCKNYEKFEKNKRLIQNQILYKYTISFFYFCTFVKNSNIAENCFYLVNSC